jgi:hypothetical protein
MIQFFDRHDRVIQTYNLNQNETDLHFELILPDFDLWRVLIHYEDLNNVISVESKISTHGEFLFDCVITPERDEAFCDFRLDPNFTLIRTQITE